MTTETTATTFTRMDESTAEQWGVIGHETMAAQPDVAEHVLALLRNLDGMVLGFAVDQLTHCLQTATLAERAGADDELVVASLCHDVGKYVSVANHPAIAATSKTIAKCCDCGAPTTYTSSVALRRSTLSSTHARSLVP